MQKQFLVALSAGLVLALFLGRSDGQGAVPSLQGTWAIQSVNHGGKSQPLPKGSHASFTKDKLTLHQGKATVEYGYHLDASKTPHWIDLSVAGVTKKMQGIYEVKGDTLYLCFNTPGGARSTQFESKAKTENDILMVFKRGK
jgi:uncharacterized protein (TIGR03067 family)